MVEGAKHRCFALLDSLLCEVITKICLNQKGKPHERVQLLLQPYHDSQQKGFFTDQIEYSSTQESVVVVNKTAMDKSDSIWCIN